MPDTPQCEHCQWQRPKVDDGEHFTLQGNDADDKVWGARNACDGTDCMDLANESCLEGVMLSCRCECDHLNILPGRAICFALDRALAIFAARARSRPAALTLDLAQTAWVISGLTGLREVMMQNADLIRIIELKYGALCPVLDERQRRQWAAAEALAYGWGGVTAVCHATGMSQDTVRKGITELAVREVDPEAPIDTPLREPGAGPKRLIDKDPAVLERLKQMVDPVTRGDPESPLRWTCKSTERLAAELTQSGHRVSTRTVAHLLKEEGFSLQGNRKTAEGQSHPDRNAQFEYINATVKRFQACGQPVISVDAKKKELVGQFRNAGREWQPKGEPETVAIHDFVDEEMGKAIPYGVDDLTSNEGWVSVGIDHDTAQFAAQAIGRWWQEIGLPLYRDATALLITADGGGSNSSRGRLWKKSLQDLATETGLQIHVCHFPPGASKWNKIEHRMFSHITQNWRGRPLISHEVILNLIANTTTRAGLTLRAELDRGNYPTGIKVSNTELANLALKTAHFHGDWNYALLPESIKTSLT